jgi:toxin HigB-1
MRSASLGFDFHALRGTPRRYSIHVNGPWGITFES